LSGPVEKCRVSARLAGPKMQSGRQVFAGRKVQNRDSGRTPRFVPSRCTECRFMKWFVDRFWFKAKASAKLVARSA
jgi:hypothetical protein